MPITPRPRRVFFAQQTGSAAYSVHCSDYSLHNMDEVVLQAAADPDGLHALRENWGHQCIELEDEQRRSPLMLACGAGLLEHVQHMTYDWDDYMLQDLCCRSFQAKDAQGWTVLQHAASSGNVGVLHVLLQQAKAQGQEYKSSTVLQAVHAAVQGNHDDMVLALVEHFGDACFGLGKGGQASALHAAARTGQPSSTHCLMAALRSKGVLKRALQSKDMLGMQPLHWSLYLRDAQSAAAMVAAGAPLHTPTKTKATPLTIACAAGHMPCIACIAAHSHPGRQLKSMPSVLSLTGAWAPPHATQLEILGTVAHCDAHAVAMRRRLGLPFVPSPSGEGGVTSPWAPLARWVQGGAAATPEPTASQAGDWSAQAGVLFAALPARLPLGDWCARVVALLLGAHCIFQGVPLQGDDRPEGTAAAPVDVLDTLACVLVQLHGAAAVAALAPAAVQVARGHAWRLRRGAVLARRGGGRNLT